MKDRLQVSRKEKNKEGRLVPDGVEKLQRHLNKICQYYHHIFVLIRYLRDANLGKIKAMWVDKFDKGPLTISLVPLPWQVIEEIGHPVSTEQLNVAFPDLMKSWEDRSYQARFHAELQIILCMEEYRMSVRISYPIMWSKRPHTKQDMLIGVSKRSCLCCFLYINHYNREFNQTWKTSGCHGKAYENWALPCSACSACAVKWTPENQKQHEKVDTAVIQDITDRLQFVLDKLMHDSQYSDDYASSQDGNKEIEWQLDEMSLRDAILPATLPVSPDIIKDFIYSLKSMRLCPLADHRHQLRHALSKRKLGDTAFLFFIVNGYGVSPEYGGNVWQSGLTDFIGRLPLHGGVWQNKTIC
jgi:hypothetical protein